MRPRTLVVDLDYTLWPAYCEFGVKYNPSALFRDARGVLVAASRAGLTLAVASRTPTPATAAAWLEGLSLTDLFVSTALIPQPAEKDGAHFPRIQNELQQAGHTGDYHHMLFFDDEHRNLCVERLGATVVIVDDGLSVAAWRKGLAKHAAARGGGGD